MYLKRKLVAFTIISSMLLSLCVPAFANNIFVDNFTNNPTYTLGNIAGQNNWTLVSTTGTDGFNVIAENAAVPATVGQGNVLRMTRASANAYGAFKSFPSKSENINIKFKLYVTNLSQVSTFSVRKDLSLADSILTNDIIFLKFAASTITYTTGASTEASFANPIAERTTKLGWNNIEIKMVHNGTAYSSASVYLNGVQLTSGSASIIRYPSIPSASIFRIGIANGATFYLDDFSISTVGPLPAPENVKWGTGNSKTVSWNSVQDATSYIGYLKKDGSLVCTYPSISTNSQDCTVAAGVYGAGQYTFSVVASNPGNYFNSPESAPSDNKTFYGIIYNPNGGTGTQTDNKVYCSGEIATVLGPGNMAKGGLSYLFTGWNTAANGTGTNYSEGSQIMMTESNVTLYSQWGINPEAVSIALGEIRKQPWGNIYGILQTYQEILEIDIDKMENLKESQRATAAKALAGKNFNKEGFIAAYNQECENAVKPVERSTARGGGSKKGSSSSFTVVPVTTPVPTPTPLPTEGLKKQGVSYGDIDNVQWAIDSIKSLSAEQIISGYPDNTFKPNDYVSREEFVKMLVLAFRVQDKDAKSNFTDVATNDWFYEYISSAVNKGLLNGVDDKNFGIGRSITRQELAVMTYRFLKNAGKEFGQGNSNFKDEGKIEQWAKEAVTAMYSAGLIKGMDDGSFMPTDYATRAQAAKVIFDSLNFIADGKNP